MLDLLLFRVLSLLRTEFSFSPCLPQSSLCVSACSVLTNRRFFLGGQPAWRCGEVFFWWGWGADATRRSISERVARPRGGTGRIRPRQARPSRVAPRDFTSEQFRWVGTRRVGAGPSRAGPSARESRAHAAGRGGYGRDKRGPPVWRRAISLRNSSAGSVRGVSAQSLRVPDRCPASTCQIRASASFRPGCMTRK